MQRWKLDDEDDPAERTGVESIAAAHRRMIMDDPTRTLVDRQRTSDILLKGALSHLFYVTGNQSKAREVWPFSNGHDALSLPKIEQLEQAGALIAREIDRLKYLKEKGLPG